MAERVVFAKRPEGGHEQEGGLCKKTTRVVFAGRPEKTKRWSLPKEVLRKTRLFHVVVNRTRPRNVVVRRIRSHKVVI